MIGKKYGKSLSKEGVNDSEMKWKLLFEKSCLLFIINSHEKH